MNSALTFEPVLPERSLVVIGRQPVLVAKGFSMQIPTTEHGVIETKLHGIPDLAVEFVFEQSFAGHHGRDRGACLGITSAFFDGDREVVGEFREPFPLPTRS